MGRPSPGIITAKAVRLLSELGVRKVLDRPSLKRLVNAAFYEFWRLIRGGPFRGEINGIRVLFYDPGGPEAYWPSFFSGHAYEHSVLKHIKLVTQRLESPTFLDIGAHYGYYTVYMSKLTAPPGKVLAFEPNSDYFKVLQTNVRLNHLRNVVLHNIALSDRRGSVVLETSEHMKSRGFPLAQRKMRALEALNSPRGAVTTVSFDELAHQRKISSDTVKIDVHGAEGNVIAGMKRSLRRVSNLYCELHGEMSNGYTARDVVALLQDAGMEISEFRGFRAKDGKLITLQNDLFSRPHNRMIYARK